MASIVSAGTTSATSLNMSADTSGVLQLASNNGTVALTIATNQNIGMGTTTPLAGSQLTLNGSTTMIPYYSTHLVNSYYDGAWKYAGNGIAWGIGNNFSGVTNGTTIAVATSNVSGSGASLTWVPALNIDTSGNVGIGTSSPARKLEVGINGAFRMQTGSVTMDCTPTPGGTDGFIWNTSVSSYYDWAFSGSTKVRIDTSGNLLVGTTAGNAKLTLSENSNLSEADAHFEIIGNGYSAYAWLDGTAYYIGQNSASRSLRIYSSAETAGVNLGPGGTSWGTFSDERLKYDIEPITNGLTKLANVRCVSYRLKDVDAEDSQKKLGVIAQDLVGVVDEVIDITKRSDDDTEYMSVRYTELIPVLVKAIQELNAKVTALENK